MTVEQPPPLVLGGLKLNGNKEEIKMAMVMTAKLANELMNDLAHLAMSALGTEGYIERWEKIEGEDVPIFKEEYIQKVSDYAREKFVDFRYIGSIPCNAAQPVLIKVATINSSQKVSGHSGIFPALLFPRCTGVDGTNFSRER